MMMIRCPLCELEFSMEDMTTRIDGDSDVFGTHMMGAARQVTTIKSRALLGHLRIWHHATTPSVAQLREANPWIS